MGKVRLLVRASTFAQLLMDLVVPDGPLEFATSRTQVEGGQMLAAEKVAQVRGSAQ